MTGPVAWLRQDWAMPPAALLRSDMHERGWGTGVLTAACARRRDRDTAARLIAEVLGGEPLLTVHAALLARGTGISADMWLIVEHDYRMGLAARLPDVGEA